MLITHERSKQIALYETFISWGLWSLHHPDHLVRITAKSSYYQTCYKSVLSGSLRSLADLTWVDFTPGLVLKRGHTRAILIIGFQTSTSENSAAIYRLRETSHLLTTSQLRKRCAARTRLALYIQSHDNARDFHCGVKTLTRQGM